MTLTTNAESGIPAFAHLSFYLDFIRHGRDNIDIVSTVAMEELWVGMTQEHPIGNTPSHDWLRGIAICPRHSSRNIMHDHYSEPRMYTLPRWCQRRTSRDRVLP
jgi:hypothetical protein